MDSRQRILAACQPRRCDRPATSLTFTSEALELMRLYLGMSKDSDNLHNDVLDELDTDLRWVGPPFIGPEERSTPTLHGEGTDFWGIGYTKVETTTNTYFEMTHHPLAEAKTVADIESHDWPSLDWWDYSAIPDLIERTNCAGRRAIAYHAGGCFETPWYMRGLEQFLIDLVTQPEIPAAVCRHVEEFYRERALRVVEASGGKIDIINSGGDIGEQQRMLLSPNLWRERIKPFTAGLITPFKKMGLHTFYHSDGSIVPVIDDLIKMGLDILDPIQVGAVGMRPEEIFPRFGDRLSFHGAIDEQHLLPCGTASEVYEETVRTIDILGQRGGYIVSATHAVQADTPAKNVAAMVKAAQDYRWS